MEFSKDLVKVSCEAMLQKNSAPSLGALISPSKTLAFQTHDRNPSDFFLSPSRFIHPGLETILGEAFHELQKSLCLYFCVTNPSISTLQNTPFPPTFLEPQGCGCALRC